MSLITIGIFAPPLKGSLINAKGIAGWFYTTACNPSFFN
jgi:hypothetical protein